VSRSVTNVAAGCVILMWNFYLEYEFIINVCMLNRGTCWFILHCIDVPVVCLAYEYVVCVFVFPWPDLEFKFLLALGVCNRLHIGIFLFMFIEYFSCLVWRVCDA
jgi:hypothetical protein